MPGITLTNPVAGTTATAGLITANNNALVTLLNLGLDNANLAANAAIDLSKLAAAAWTTYTPAWTSSGVAPALGNGTIAGHYIQIGKTVLVRIGMVLGTTSTVGTGQYKFSLPVTKAPLLTATESLGVGHITDASAAAVYPVIGLTTATATMDSIYTTASPGALVGATTPVVPAVSDRYDFDLVYEAA